MKEHRILHIEDSRTDADIVKRVLERAGLHFQYCLVENEVDLYKALNEFEPDMVLSDHSLPSFNSKMAFSICKEKNPDIPFILVTGTVSEEFAVDMMKSGVDDYLLKSHLQRLPAAIDNTFTKKQNNKKVKAIQKELEQSLTHLRTIFDNSIAGLVLVDVNGRILEINDRAQYYNLYSFGRELLKEENIFSAFPEKSGQELKEKLMRTLEGESNWFESVYPGKDGSIVAFIINLSPIIDAEGKIGGACFTIEEITERKKAEQEIKRSNERFELIGKATHDAMWEWNLETNELWANEMHQQLYGLGPDDPVSNDNEWRKRLHDDDRKRIVDSIEETLASKENTWEGEYRLLSENKGWMYIWGQTYIVRNKDGKPVRMMGSMMDITERKISEEALAKSEMHLRTILHTEPECIKLLNREGILEDMNPAGLAMIEADDLQQVSGKSVLGIIDKPYRQGFLKLTENVFNGNPGKMEFTITGLKGTSRWLETHAVPLRNTEGKIIFLLGITRDITEKKLAEQKAKETLQRYDILAQATSDTIWDWDITNNKMFYNEGIKKMFGYADSEIEYAVEWWNEKLHPDDFKKVADSLEDVFEKGLQKVQLIYRYRCADGSYKHIFDRAFVLFDENGKPYRMIGAMQDITYQVQEDIRISKAIMDAHEEERNRIGEELHDNVNQILAGSLLSLGMAKDARENLAKSSEFIDITRNYINNAIDEIRKLSHELVVVRQDDNSLKNLFETLLSSINLDKRFNVNLHFEEFDEKIIPDDVQINLYRILQEQVKNIMKYSEASSVEVAVTLAEKNIRMRIYDNGIGFDTTVKKKGIGLANIKKRAESLSGKLILNSSPGKGCEIILMIPIGPVFAN